MSGMCQVERGGEAGDSSVRLKSITEGGIPRSNEGAGGTRSLRTARVGAGQTSSDSGRLINKIKTYKNSNKLTFVCFS